MIDHIMDMNKTKQKKIEKHRKKTRRRSINRKENMNI